MLMVIGGQISIHANSVSIGPSLVFERLWKDLGLPGIIFNLAKERKYSFNIERAIFLTVLHRLFQSGSDRQCDKWREGYQIEGTEKISLHHLYRAMSFLRQEVEDQRGKTPVSPRCIKDGIEEKLFQRRMDLFSSLDLVFFDTTSIYFEGYGGDSLGYFGHSKDHRPDLNQMIVGAVLNNQGDPICCELWPGYTADVNTLLPVTDRIRSRFGVKQFCIVADRGMISAKTIEGLEKRDIHYILGVKMRLQKFIREDVLSRAGRFEPVRTETEDEDHDPLKVKEVIEDGKRFIICMNEKQARRDAAARQAILEVLEEKLETNPGSLIGNRGFKKYLRLRKGSFTINKKKIESEKRFDGKWVLQTNTNLPSAEVALKYKELWQVEDGFYAKYIVMQSRRKSHIVDQPVIRQLYTTTLHNNIIVEYFLTNQVNSYSFPIHNDWPFRGQGSYMLFQALPASA